MCREDGRGISCYSVFFFSLSFQEVGNVRGGLQWPLHGRGHSWGETLLSPFPQTLRMKHQQKPQIHQHLLALLDRATWDSAVNSLWPQHLFHVKPASPLDPQMLSVHILRDSHWQRIWKETVTDPKEICKCKHITGSRVCLS